LEAQDHLEFHRTYNTDIVKVMNDFDYPHSTTGKWYELRPLDSPFPDQLATLKLVRDGLNGDAYFIDTIYGPYMTAMILFQSQPQFARLGKSEEVQDEQIKSPHAFQQQNPDAWARCVSGDHAVHHQPYTACQGHRSLWRARQHLQCRKEVGTVADYERYTRPYDKRVFDALADTKLTILHLHYLERPYLDQFKDFNAPVIQYSVKTSGIPISEVRKKYSQPIAGGVDEIDYEKLTVAEIRTQWTEARAQAGAKYIAAPGCSVPNSSTPEELARFPRALGI
jgi:hypothetical protein